MPAPRQWFKDWIHRALYEEEGWPYDPVNSGILLGLLYLGLPIAGICALTLLILDWSPPIWLSASLVYPAFFATWIALDEWRSRRRCEGGHGWIWQMVETYWPRRLINRAAIIALVAAFAISSIITYVDRFQATNLADSHAVFIAEVIVIVPLDLWALVVLFGWAKSNRDPDDSAVRHYWGAASLAVAAVAVIGSLLPVGENLTIWVVIPGLLFFLIFLPGKAIAAIVDRFKGQRELDVDAAPSGLVTPSWW